MIEVNGAVLAAHPFLHGMSADHLGLLADAVRDVSFPARYRLFEDGGNATRFWLIQAVHSLSAVLEQWRQKLSLIHI